MLRAQCPDGTPPPCAGARTPPRVAVDSNAVAILPFRVSGPADAQYLGEGMVDLLSVALDGFAGWRVIQPRALLRAIGGSGATTVDAAQASRLAREAGAGSYVIGSVIALGTELRVQADLYQAGRTTPLASVRSRGTLTEPGPVADSIAAGFGRYRAARQPGIARRPLAEYTTTSPSALQAYLVAEQLARHARWAEAAESLVAAIGRDSTFALAYYELYRVISWGNTGPTLGSSANASLLATVTAWVRASSAILDRAPQRQRRLLEFIATWNRVENLQRADALARDYPDDADVALERGDAYFHIGLQMGESPALALQALERAIALDPVVPEAYLHAVQLHCMMGDTVSAWRALARLRQLTPDWPAAVGLDLALRAVLRGEDPATMPVAAEILPTMPRRVLVTFDRTPARAVQVSDAFASRLAGSAASPADRVVGLRQRHVLLIAQGRYGAAWDVLRQAVVLDPDGPELLGATIVHHLITGAHASEAAAAARQLATRRGPPPLWASAVLAWRLAALGPVDSASALRALLASVEYPEFAASLAEGLAGLVALRSGDTATARQRLPSASATWIELRDIEEFFPNPWLALLTARLDQRAGDLDAAERRLHETMGAVGVMFRAEAEELRGAMAEQRGDTAAAIRAYGNFVALWANADPELQPRVARAREALARLSAR